MNRIASAALLVLLAGRGSASTIVVNSTADPGAPGICTLRDAIAAANTDAAVNACVAGHGTDTIDLTGITGTITVTGNGLPIDSSMSIVGPGAAMLAVDGGGTFGVVFVTAAHTRTTMSGLTITNRELGVRNNGKLVLTNCVVSNNDGDGGIETMGSLAVDGCTFTGNTGPFAADIDMESGRLTVRRSMFSNSTHRAIALSGGLARIADSSFTTPTGGAGAAISNLTAIATVTNCLFLNNQSNSVGAAIDNSSRMTVTGCTFSGNHGTLGGAVFNDKRLTVRNSTFGGNTSDTDGGAIENAGKLYITNSTFANNSAANDGGAIASGAGTTLLTNTTFANNSAATGGALFFDPSGCGAGPCIMSFRNSIVANSTGSSNCSGPITNRRGNLDSDGSCGDGPATDPQLDPGGLADNGGPTQTIALQPTSPAINAGMPACPRTDQRGYLRPGTGATHCSIGAFEFNSPGCPSRLTACGAMNVCTDLRSDDNNCGACGTACAPGQTCKRGACH